MPNYYAYGPRSLNVLLTQLRFSASFLNYDLFKVNILSEPSCRCGNNREDSYHFFFECRLYTDLRITLLNKLNWLPDDCILDLNLLTCGSNLISNEQNEYVFRCVYEYIKKTERFLLAWIHICVSKTTKPHTSHITFFLLFFFMYSFFVYIS